jgi:hypothetical protein
MTRDEKDRLTALEVRMDGQDRVLKTIASDVRVVRDAMLIGQGAVGAHAKISAKVWAVIIALSSVFGGGVGAFVVKKIS